MELKGLELHRHAKSPTLLGPDEHIGSSEPRLEIRTHMPVQAKVQKELEDECVVDGLDWASTRAVTSLPVGA